MSATTNAVVASTCSVVYWHDIRDCRFELVEERAMTIESIVAEAVAQIEASHAARERAIATSRALIRQCANAIRAVHRGQFAEAEGLLGEATGTARSLRASVANEPALLYAGYTQDALKEYAEAALVYAFLHGDTPPGPAAIQVEPAAYLNGLAEAASELRRAILDSLRHGEVLRGEALLEVLERTRGDMTAAIRQEQLSAALAAFEGKIGGAA